MHRHAKNVPSPQEIGIHYPEYRPTYRFWGNYIDRFHRYLSKAPTIGEGLVQLRNYEPTGEWIQGWMSRPEVLKLYELAYFAPGDILEIGCYQGLSTFISAKAIRHSGKPRTIYSLDLFEKAMQFARWNLHVGKSLKHARFVVGDAYAITHSYALTGKRFAFAFVDFSHEYRHVYEVCTLLYQVMQPGGFVLFHDYNDPRNVDPNEPDYGVYQGVVDGFNPRYFDFYGIYGSTGLYRVKE